MYVEHAISFRTNRTERVNAYGTLATTAQYRIYIAYSISVAQLSIFRFAISRWVIIGKKSWTATLPEPLCVNLLRTSILLFVCSCRVIMCASVCLVHSNFKVKRASEYAVLYDYLFRTDFCFYYWYFCYEYFCYRMPLIGRIDALIFMNYCVSKFLHNSVRGLEHYYRDAPFCFQNNLFLMLSVWCFRLYTIWYCFRTNWK